MEHLKNLPLVSVLMPAYNSEAYIGQAIESVLASTYTNFELIITDDRSTDNTYPIAMSYADKDPRVKVILNDKNYGDYPNRNQAALYAKGKYIKYVDHDDYIYPYGLEQLVFYMEQFPEAGYGLCSLPQHAKRMYPFQLAPKETYVYNYFESEIFQKAPLSSIIRRDAFEALGGFTGKPFLGDYEFWHLLSQKFSVVLMPHGIVWYRVHEMQESKRMKEDPVHSFRYLEVGELMINSDNCPLNIEEKATVLKSLYYKQARSIVSAVKHDSVKKALQLKKMTKLSYIEILKYLFKL